MSERCPTLAGICRYQKGHKGPHSFAVPRNPQQADYVKELQARVEALSAALREILLAYDADEGWPQAMEAARKLLEDQ